MAPIHIPGRRSDSSNGQSVLQQSYFIAVLVIVFGLIILRIIVLRWRNRSMSEFFRLGAQRPNDPQAPSRPNYGLLFPGPQVTPLPAVYFSDRRVRAADIDSQGRRVGSAGDGDGKDILPAYDNFDRPPKYIEAGWSLNHPVERSAAILTPEGDQSGIVHPNDTNLNMATGDNSGHLPDDSHDITSPPVHHDLATS